MDADVLVVGAGPAGPAVTACLREQGVEPLVVDRGCSVGESWRRRDERLHLRTPRVQSVLSGPRIPRSFGRWVRPPGSCGRPPDRVLAAFGRIRWSGGAKTVVPRA